MRKEEHIPNQVFGFLRLEDHSASSFQLQAWEVVTKGSSVWRLPLLLASWLLLPTADVLGQPGVSDRPGHGSCMAQLPQEALVCHPCFVGWMGQAGEWGVHADPAWSHRSVCSWATGQQPGKGNAEAALPLYTFIQHAQEQSYLPRLQSATHCPFLGVCSAGSWSMGLNSSLASSDLLVPPPMNSTLCDL